MTVQVLLSAYSQAPPPTPYCVWGAAVAEVEVDVLTGACMATLHVLIGLHRHA